MWVIVGLGNPGRRYARTRHNIGFRVVDRLAETFLFPLKVRDLFEGGRGIIDGQDSFLLKPLTYMNRSGLAVKAVVKYRPVDASQIIVVHDDIDLKSGIVKIRRNGSSGGHRGIESVIEELGSDAFLRVKIGIGRSRDIPAEEYVLMLFRESEREVVDQAVATATDAVIMIVAEGVDKAMNVFNRANKPDTELGE